MIGRGIPFKLHEYREKYQMATTDFLEIQASIETTAGISRMNADSLID